MLNVKIKADCLQQNALQQDQFILSDKIDVKNKKLQKKTSGFLLPYNFGYFSLAVCTMSLHFFGVSSTLPARNKQASAIIFTFIQVHFLAK